MANRRPPNRTRKPAGGGRRGRRGISPGRFVALLLAAVSLFAVGVFFGDRLVERGREIVGAKRSTPTAAGPAAPRNERAAGAAKANPKIANVPDAKPVAPAGAKAVASDTPDPIGKGEPAASGPRARVAIVVDDLGHDVESVERLLALGVPLSYAVLPFEPHSTEVGEILRGRGAELLLHLPMEPEGTADPGRGALSERMSAQEIADATRAALDAVPGVTGMNNHMGSAVTADRATMSAAIQVLQERDLFFLDSRTTRESVAFDVAIAAGVPTARRDVFLDEVDERAAIGVAIDRLVELARSQGAAIGIAHPRAETLAAFEARLPGLAAQGVELVPVSYLLQRSDSLPD